MSEISELLEGLWGEVGCVGDILDKGLLVGGFELWEEALERGPDGVQSVGGDREVEDASSESAVVGIDAAAFGELFEISGGAFVGLLLEIAHPEGFGAVRVSQMFEQEGGFVKEGCLFGSLEQHEFKDAQEEVGLVVFFGEIGKEAEGFVVFGGLEDLLEELMAVGRSEGAVDLFEPREIFPLEGLGEEFGCDFLEGEAVSVDADSLGDKGAIDGGEAF